MTRIMVFLLSPALAILLTGCCCTRDTAAEYGAVESAVRNVQEALYGEFGAVIPDTLNSASFFDLLWRTERYNEHKVLSAYTVKLQPAQGSYLLIVKDGEQVIIFDYGCTRDVDGPMFRGHTRYLETHPPCGQSQ